MFGRLLIANRGEIACRIARTARRMGIETVAIYSEADSGAAHVNLADEAWSVGPAPASESYLSIDKIIAIAAQSGAEAVHPGYGFLSESAAFAERCVRAGLIFVGPPASAMRMMGSKAAAKALMADIGAPLLPGYHGEAQDFATLSEAALKLGYPVLVKASAGGGGRGMRVVRSPAGLSQALESAAREALSAFGDNRLLIERYLERPRHIEIQVFADMQGNVATFLERDCSLQRNHQKIVEETPAARLDPEIRLALRGLSVKAARASGYVGAGTVEFLVKDDDFYFLEMNTRLQVEHPVTEMISGVDLVEWQFRVACGEPLPLRQDEIQMRGCAIEARICAEDPARDFLPSTGTISHLRLPEPSCNVRVDTGVREGDRVSSNYDSLLAKLVVRGENRANALARLQRALNHCEVVGVRSNLDFLRALAGQAEFVSGDYDTGFVEGHEVSLNRQVQCDEALLLAAGAFAWREAVIEQQRQASKGAASPWGVADAWRLFNRQAQEVSFGYEGRVVSCRIRPMQHEAFELEASDMRYCVTGGRDHNRTVLCVDGVCRSIGLVASPEGYVVIVGGRNHFLERVDPFAPPHESVVAHRPLVAPLPARVTRVLVRAGDHVEKGAPLLILEAMKMEIALTAPRSGVVESVLCDEGQAVLEGSELVGLAEAG